jgi:beta-mannosidase
MGRPKHAVTEPAGADVRVDLNGTWQLTYGPQTAAAPRHPDDLAASDWPSIPATVPGNVELDLMRSGLLPADLHMANNVYKLVGFEGHRWWYRRTFDTPAARPGQRLVLIFEGIDCVGEVFLNGRSLGRVANMLIAHEFEVTGLLRTGAANDLAVRIDSAVLAGREHRPDAVEFASAHNWESLSIRKAPQMYGWDIMPRIVSAGLWRGVRLELRGDVRLSDVHWATMRVDPQARTAELLVDWQIDTSRADLGGLLVRVELHRGDCVYRSEHPVHGAHGRTRVSVKNAAFWWPRGAGDAALYDGLVAIVDRTGRKLHQRHTRVGIRTVELRRTDVTDDQGGEFLFVVNGRPIFCRGTNHVPLDALHSRDGEHLMRVLPMLVDLNCNMVRCWGGNVYEDHAFFDFCDEHGIMVWQDFAMACCIYPQTDGFAEQIRHEADSIIRKLHNHPSLVLWAGNNEIDQAYGWSGSCVDPNTDRLSRQVLPDAVRRLDPFRPYLPSSPYYSPELVRRGIPREQVPEDHLWGPRDDFKGPYYTTSGAHFVSEIGYHGCPDRQSLEQMMDADHLWPWQSNDQWLTHAVRPTPDSHDYDYRIALMARQIRVLFDADPANLDDFVLASQISQAEAVKYFIERWRMGKWRRTGMLWWNLRDGWPVISDAVVDYFGRKKLAYHYIKRVQADICVSIAEPEAGRHQLVVVSDLAEAMDLDVRVRDADSGQSLLSISGTASADSVTMLGQLPASARPAMWSIDWTARDVTAHNHYLAGPRPFRLEDYRRWLTRLGQQHDDR